MFPVLRAKTGNGAYLNLSGTNHYGKKRRQGSFAQREVVIATTLKVIIGILCALFFATGAVVLLKKSMFLLSLAFILVAMASLYTWLLKKNLTYRFLFPGMLAFALFTIIPIIFSVFISFTNLGTGHFFSQEKVTSILLSEKIITGEGEALFFLLFDDGVIQVKKANAYFTGNISKTSQDIELSPLKAPYENKALLPAQVFNTKEKLKKKRFRLPSGETYLYHRVDKLIRGQFLYEKHNESAIKNLITGNIYQANPAVGAFISQDGKDRLEPGFYTFVGLKNFSDLFGKEEFRKTFLKVSVWTFVWALVSVALTFSLGLSLALFINDKNLRFKAIYRNLLILPYSIPFFISVLVFKGMLNKDFGVVNHALQSIGLHAIPWLEDGLWAKVSCLMVNLWLGFPYMFLLTTGILQSIPESVYEAAKIDGATKWQAFRSITLPMILNSITPLLIGAFAFNLGNFVGIYLLTGGGPAMAEATTPAGQTDILISYTYRLAFEGAMGQQFGLASSIALFIFFIIGTLTFLNFKFFNKGQEL